MWEKCHKDFFCYSQFLGIQWKNAAYAIQLKVTHLLEHLLACPAGSEEYCKRFSPSQLMLPWQKSNILCFFSTASGVKTITCDDGHSWCFKHPEHTHTATTVVVQSSSSGGEGEHSSPITSDYIQWHWVSAMNNPYDAHTHTFIYSFTGSLLHLFNGLFPLGPLANSFLIVSTYISNDGSDIVFITSSGGRNSNSKLAPRQRPHCLHPANAEKNF